ncbi:MAG: DNA-directed RNA polymerase subunit omega, partial [Nitrospirae bacterium]|nr:DNA-directed RNA polymerase subunit omega [Nitrospirota bacterium]
MDLISLPIMNDNQEIDTRFRLVILASHRVRDLAD